jgi:rhodanese/phosphatase family RapZ-like protein
VIAAGTGGDILDLDGLHPRVQDVVLNTPGARELLANLTDYADLPAGPRGIAIGCAGGRHRASGPTELLARALQERGREVTTEACAPREPTAGCTGLFVFLPVSGWLPLFLLSQLLDQRAVGVGVLLL